MTISVVVPIYNTSKYLKDCLDCLLNQTYKDLEIICINDGSTDNSFQILEEYRSKDERIIVINQQNKGLAETRNVGIAHAKGDFIAFIDSDDWVDTDFYQKLYDAIVENKADVAAASIIRTRKYCNKVRIKYNKVQIIENIQDIIKAINPIKCSYVWNKLYKTDLIKNIEFKKDAYFEDILWTPLIIEKTKRFVTVPNTNYYYRAHSKSIVKNQTRKKQEDSYFAKKFLLEFYKKYGVELSKKARTIKKSYIYFLNMTIFKIKEFENTEIYYLFGFIPVFKKKIKTPIIKDNTFLVWEPCSKSHSEVVPGYCKYLLDLGYHVSVLINPQRYKEGLFSKFREENISYNYLTRKEASEYFKHNNLQNVKGVMVTTVGKLCDCVHYDRCYESFYPTVDKNKLLFVEHEASFAADKGLWSDKLITLRKLNYKGAKSIVINPHYYGDVKITPKNNPIVNFITIGQIKPNKKNAYMIVDAVETIYKKGYDNFKITVIGKGSLKNVPKEIRKYFDIKGRLSFNKMYDEIEKSDFFLMPYNEFDPEHIRYNTSGTSGNFQLIYGFIKPCIIVKSFAKINGFDDTNAILYDKDDNFYKAMIKAIELSDDEYSRVQKNLKELSDRIYASSKENLQHKIKGDAVAV